VAIASISGAVALGVNAPKQYSGTTQNDDFELEVKDSTEQPVKITVSHSFKLVTTVGSYKFKVAPGEALFVDYNLTVRDSSGQKVLDANSTFDSPATHTFPSSATTDTVTRTDSHPIELRPGKYRVSLVSDHPVDYRIEQSYKLQDATVGLGALGALFLIIAVGLTMFAKKKRDAQNRSGVIAILSSGQPPWQSMPSPAVPPPYYPSAPPPAPYSMYIPAAPPPPPPGTPDRSTLEYVPGGTYVDLVCLNCGQVVANRPVNGIMTCEHCGEQARVQ
jgi:hypothetical protein